MSTEFTHRVVFCWLIFLKFDTNVFLKALSIQRFFNLTKYREVVGKHLQLIYTERWWNIQFGVVGDAS